MKTLEEFSEIWIASKDSKFLMCVVYDLLIEEADTDVLINLLGEHDKNLKKHFFVFENFDDNNEMYDWGADSSFRTHFLTKGKYEIVITFSKFNKLEKNFLKHSEFENKTFIRFAASKKCSIEKNESKSRKKKHITWLETL